MSKTGLGQETFLRQKRQSSAVAQVEGVGSEKQRCRLSPSSRPAIQGWGPWPLPGCWPHLWDSVSSSAKCVNALFLSHSWGRSGILQERKPGVARPLCFYACLFCALR